MAALAGWQGQVTILDSNLSLPVTRWQVTWQAEKIDLTNAEDSAFASDSYYQRIWQASYVTLACNFDCLWDTSLTSPLKLNPTSTGNQGCLQPGFLVKLKLYPNSGGSNPSPWNLDSCLIESVVMESEVRGVCKYSVTGTQAKLPGNIASTPFYPT